MIFECWKCNFLASRKSKIQNFGTPVGAYSCIPLAAKNRISCLYMYVHIRLCMGLCCGCIQGYVYKENQIYPHIFILIHC